MERDQRGPLRYYLDFLIPPVAAVAVALGDAARWSASWVALAVFGLVLFTFLEYWTHRVILHRIMWHSTHQRHHAHPSEYVVFPWWYLPGIFLAFWVVLPAPVFSGFMAGATWFYVWHHAIHHWDLAGHPWVQEYERWHEMHHADLPVNYGITHPGWDLVFGTYMSPTRVDVKKSQKWA